MRWSLLVVVVVCAGGAAAAATTCTLAENFFRSMNVSADDSDRTGLVCNGQCCGRRREEELRRLVKNKMVMRAANSLRPISDLLLSTRNTLQDHLTVLSQQSQNKTSLLFAQVYRSHATRAHAPISALYEDVRTLLQPSIAGLNTDADELGTPPPRDLADSARRFFRDVFPVAYHNVLKLDAKQFTPEYESCLRDAYDAVQPFGDVPQQLGTSLSRSLEAWRSLLQALALGAGALAASEEVLRATDSDACSTVLLRATACARCRGLDARPCQNYCLNVVRGCLGSLLSELDSPWSGYVEGVERLARGDADAALRALDSRVSEAIMYALENHVTLEKKVRQECGPPSSINTPGATMSHSTGNTARRDALRAPPPDTELLQFAASLAASRRLFAELSDKICDDDDLAHDENDNCWNGENIWEYTKPLVSFNDQRYNPEVTGVTIENSRITSLADRLRRARELLVSYMWSDGPPAAEAFMQGDAAGEGEGSGSGRSYPDDDAAYDSEGSGEGSGHDRIEGRIYTGEGPMDTVSQKTAAATISRPAASFVIGLSLMTLIQRSLT